MRTRNVLTIATLALTVGLLASSAGATETAQAFKLDPQHSYVVFRVMHLDIAWTYGSFRQVEGTFTLDPGNPAGSSFEVAVKVESVDTHVDKRDQHIRSPDFFDAKQFPLMTFKSTKVEKTANGYQVTGDLTVHGVTKSISLPLVKTGEGDDPWGNHRAGFQGEFSIKRSDFGMTFMPKIVGEDVHITVSAEGVRQ